MKRQISILLHIFLLLALSACRVTNPSPSPMPSPTATTQPSRLPDPNEVKALLVRVVDEEKRVPGIVVGMIANDPQERWVVGYGRLSATDDRVPDGNTVFEIGSVTKVFTRILLAQAVVEGEVKMDDPISLYLPEGVTAPEYEGRSITLLDLAMHTSGLPREPGNLSSWATYTMDQMYDFLSGYRLTRAPGSISEYSNYGYGLLGNLLVRVAGQTDYEALLLERITRPLDMDSTRIVLTPEMSSRLAAPHASYSVATISWDAPAFDGAGSIRSTANDMLTFLAANMGLTETKLQPALQLTKSGKGTHFQNGNSFGYHSYLAWDSERKIGVVVLTNAAISIDDVALQLLRGFSLAPILVDPQVLATYAGKYQFPDGPVVTIRVEGTRIFTQTPNQPEYELLARTENQFYPREFEAEITFYRNDKGEVDRMVLLESGETYEAKKVP